jgi:hypothetical protein
MAYSSLSILTPAPLPTSSSADTAAACLPVFFTGDLRFFFGEPSSPSAPASLAAFGVRFFGVALTFGVFGVEAGENVSSSGS